ncbi:hypothetical protein ACA910_022465 [Epithemia clementina (nom. ined.)]
MMKKRRVRFNERYNQEHESTVVDWATVSSHLWYSRQEYEEFRNQRKWDIMRAQRKHREQVLLSLLLLQQSSSPLGQPQSQLPKQQDKQQPPQPQPPQQSWQACAKQLVLFYRAAQTVDYILDDATILWEQQQPLLKQQLKQQQRKQQLKLQQQLEQQQELLPAKKKRPPQQPSQPQHPKQPTTLSTFLRSSSNDDSLPTTTTHAKASSCAATSTKVVGTTTKGKTAQQERRRRRVSSDTTICFNSDPRNKEQHGHENGSHYDHGYGHDHDNEEQQRSCNHDNIHNVNLNVNDKDDDDDSFDDVDGCWWEGVLGLEIMILTDVKLDILRRRDQTLQVVAEIQDECAQGLWNLSDHNNGSRDSDHTRSTVRSHETEDDNDEDADATSVSTESGGGGGGGGTTTATTNDWSANDEYYAELRDSCRNYSQTCQLFAQLLAQMQRQYYTTDSIQGGP